MTKSDNPQNAQQPFEAAGTLVVSKTNPRYFTVKSGNVDNGRAVYLAGAHVNNNFYDGAGPGADYADTPDGDPENDGASVPVK